MIKISIYGKFGIKPWCGLLEGTAIEIEGLLINKTAMSNPIVLNHI